MGLVKKRIQNKRVLRLLQKWLRCRIIEGGEVRPNQRGIPQGAVIGPLLANIYLHYALDSWLHSWRKTKTKGDVIAVRYGDDAVIGFQYKNDVIRFENELRDRLVTFQLELHPGKTRTIEFGRFAEINRKARGKRTQVFDFLGFALVVVPKLP